MLTVDGSQGEGGGQVLRSSLALSMVTGQPVKISNIRAKRAKPGLMRQHLTAVNASAEICGATVDGAELRSRELTFRPGNVQSGDFAFRIGTAGSTGLVLQTVLPALLCADSPCTVTVEGGTHNPTSPPFDFLERAYLPLVCRMGPHVEAKLERPGFYPAGGGRISVTVEPSESLGPLHLQERGRLLHRRLRALVAQLPEHIGERECSKVVRGLHWPQDCAEVVSMSDSAGPGNALVAELRFKNVTEVFTAFGERGKPAERVGQEVLSQLRRYLNCESPVGEHLADQLMLPLAIGAWQGTGGGTFRTLGLSRHSDTHVDVIRQFLDVDVETIEHDRNNVEVRIS